MKSISTLFKKSDAKWQLISSIKDRLVHYLSEEYRYTARQMEWEYKVPTGELQSKEKFETTRKEQIRWAVEQSRMNHYKAEAVSEVLRIIEEQNEAN